MKNREARCGVLVTVPSAMPGGRMFKQLSQYMFAIAYDVEDPEWADLGIKLLGALYGITRATLISEELGRAGTVDQVALRRALDSFKAHLGLLDGAVHSAHETVRQLDEFLEGVPELFAAMGRAAAGV